MERKETYNLDTVNPVSVGYRHEPRNLLLIVPFEPGLLVTRLIPKVEHGDLEHGSLRCSHYFWQVIVFS